ncbi:ABC-2 transporter permease [Paenibacillus hexagrammi]|uniref:ABC-2 transporter permease n=1 Tax=Paenibacillus hexagrammi TaxID=2908839 RepID=A0ABY3SL85_9BACL|nr:ABC-2 transporter permease [Paenibacillus sp. YPD9-1]UJF34155.1 ABC-2 transporter permease [Paenibacillus sp. YPD9-1]
MWNQIWRLATMDLSKRWLMLVGSIAFYVYCGLVMNLMEFRFHDALDSKFLSIYLAIISNFFVLAIIPNLGFPLKKKYLNYWKTDIFSKRLAFLKSLPISNREIVWSRYVQVLIVMMLMSTIFFSSYWLISVIFGDAGLHFGTYLLFAITWIGYSMLMSALYVFWELALWGKQYFIRNIMMIPVYAAIGVLLWLFMGNSLWETVLSGIVVHPVLMPLISLAAGITAVGVSGRRLEKKLEERDYS